jgi:hypothetical protein
LTNFFRSLLSSTSLITMLMMTSHRDYSRGKIKYQNIVIVISN